MKYNRICQILGIEKPVIQGPLSWLTDARLVAAVSNAGGLGVLGPIYAGCVSACWKVIQMKDTLRWARALEISAASRA